MTRGRTTYAVILGVILTAGGCSDFFKSGGGGGAPPHKLTAVLIDSTCQDAKEAVVKVKSKGKVDWYVVSECGDYDQKTVSIEFVDSNGNHIPFPTASGDCAKCSDRIKTNGFVKLTLDAKEVTGQPQTFDYKVWIGTTQEPHQKVLTDPKLEIDP